MVLGHMQILFDLLGDTDQRNENSRLCVLPDADHKYSRPKALRAIAYFLNDEIASLDEELILLRKGEAGADVNPYSD